MNSINRTFNAQQNQHFVLFGSRDKKFNRSEPFLGDGYEMTGELLFINVIARY